MTIGFNGVQNLENGKVDAFTGFMPADGVQIEVDGYPTTTFTLDEYGGPQYPGLVMFSTEEQDHLRSGSHAGLRQRHRQGLRRGDGGPAGRARRAAGREPGDPRGLAEAQLKAYEPLFVGDADGYGVFHTDKLEELSTTSSLRG